MLARIGVATGALAVANGVILFVFQFWFNEPVAGSVSVFAASMYAVSFGLFLKTGSIRIFAGISLGVSLVAVIVIHVVLGGFIWSGYYLAWGIVNVVLAAFWLPTRVAAMLGVLWACAAVVLVFLEPTLQERRTRPDEMLALLNAAQAFLMSLLFFTPAILFIRGRLFVEQRRSRSLLLNVLPEPIADRLEAEPGVIADTYESCSVLFADLVGFTSHARTVSAEALVRELNDIFTEFDHVVAASKGEKIKTIGDGYMAAFGVPDPNPDHRSLACTAALAMLERMQHLNRQLGTEFQLRIGVASGPVVAGVIGESKFAYDLWSESVILASRLESVAEPGEVLVSAATAENDGSPHRFVPKGSIDLKGRGPTEAFRLESVPAEDDGAV